MKGNPKGFFKKDTQMDFCISKKTKLYKKILNNPIYPKFNNDRRFYTPGFLIPHIESIT